jgi:hypothetical protein
MTTAKDQGMSRDFFVIPHFDKSLSLDYPSPFKPFAA